MIAQQNQLPGSNGNAAEEASGREPVSSLLDPVSRDFYQSALRYLRRAGIGFLVGGAYSFARHTGIERHTKDFDIFLRPADCPRALETLSAAGYSTQLVFPHWLGKAMSGDNCLDIIFGSGNGVARVDDGWFEHAIEDRVVDTPVLLCPVEETIWSKAFVMERERFDGADIAHLIRASGKQIDWRRLVDRFGSHWRVLLAHLTLFGFIYPGERDCVPPGVVQALLDRVRDEHQPPLPANRVCQGTLISRAQYLVDIEHWGYEDARTSGGHMTPAEIDVWTAAIGADPPTACTRPLLQR